LSAPAEQSTVCPLTSFRLASLTALKPSGYITLAAYRFIRHASDVKKGALAVRTSAPHQVRRAISAATLPQMPAPAPLAKLTLRH